MNFPKLFIAVCAGFLLTACAGAGNNTSDKQATSEPEDPVNTIEADPLQNKGIGPVKSVTLEEINEQMVLEGEKIFQVKCSACHKTDQKYIGPAPKGILERRSPEWVMNMILNPEEMLQKDPIAKQLLMEANGAIMANQGLTEEEARNILEYFRTLE